MDANPVEPSTPLPPAPVVVYEAFQRFPVPLAIAEPSRGIVQCNKAWRRRYGRAVLPADALSPTDEGPRTLRLRVPGAAEGLEVRATAIPVPGCTVLVAGNSADAEADDIVFALRGRLANLEKLATTDHLTGAWNRAHFDRVIGLELERSHADGRPLSLVLLDVDHFKRINDRLGHAAGDATLVELVALVRAMTRPSDLLFRWGGEEFALLVSSAGHRGAARVAEKLREAVEAHRFAHGLPLTVSAGVAEHAAGEDANAWFARLDAALYAAKAGGRNRVVVDGLGESDEPEVANVAALRLEWREAYECGEPGIDEEHRELFERANRVIAAALDPESSLASRLAVLDGFLEHVARHFAHEEAILAKRGYAELALHHEAHAGLLRRAGWMRARVQSGESALGALVEFLVQDVVARHLLTVDRAFFPLFADGQPAPA